MGKSAQFRCSSGCPTPWKDRAGSALDPRGHHGRGRNPRRGEACISSSGRADPDGSGGLDRLATAFLAASMALVSYDIKRVLAFSTDLPTRAS